MNNKNVAIIGASDKPERYSHKCLLMLEKFFYEPFLVHPNLKKIEGHKVFSNLLDIQAEIDTVTLYIAPKLQTDIEQQILTKKVRRVIFNPGTENSELEKKLQVSGVEVLRACTLVLLSTDQFE